MKPKQYKISTLHPYVHPHTRTHTRTHTPTCARTSITFITATTTRDVDDGDDNNIIIVKVGFHYTR